MNLYRLGSYGTIQVDWLSGFLTHSEGQGYQRGIITPDSGTEIMQNGVEEIIFNIQVSVSLLVFKSIIIVW